MHEHEREKRRLRDPVLHCGVTWGGNTGLQIAHLIGKRDALGEAFTLVTDEGLIWADVASFYEELAGARFESIPAADYLEIATRQGCCRCSPLYRRRPLPLAQRYERQDGGDGAERNLADLISIFNEYGWDWTYHAFREWPGWSVEHKGRR